MDKRKENDPISDLDYITDLENENNHFITSLKKLACLGNGDLYGNSIGNRIAQDTLKQFNRENVVILSVEQHKKIIDTEAKLKTLLSMAICPECNGSGGGMPIQVTENDWIQQCQWCFEKNEIIK